MGAGEKKTSHPLEDVSIFDPKMSFTIFNYYKIHLGVEEVRGIT